MATKRTKKKATKKKKVTKKKAPSKRRAAKKATKKKKASSRKVAKKASPRKSASSRKTSSKKKVSASKAKASKSSKARAKRKVTTKRSSVSSKKPATRKKLSKPRTKPTSKAKRPTLSKRSKTTSKISKPQLKKPVAKKKKGKKKAASKGQYRRMRKWTLPKLVALIEDPKVIRNRIHSDKRGALQAGELIEYIRLEEKTVPDWRKKQLAPGGKKRPKKKDTKAKAARIKAPKPVKDPKKALANAGKLLPNARKGKKKLNGKARKAKPFQAPPRLAKKKRPVFKKPLRLRA